MKRVNFYKVTFYILWVVKTLRSVCRLIFIDKVLHPDIPYSTDTASASHDEPDPTMDTDTDQLDTSPTPVVQAVSTQPRSDILIAYATASGTYILFKSLISKIDGNSLTSKGPEDP